MQVTLEQLSSIPLFKNLDSSELRSLQSSSKIYQYQMGETIFQEGDKLPGQLYSLLQGSLQMSRIATTGKETILRTLTKGEIFAAPALVGNGIAPATVVTQSNSEILTVKREALITVIGHNPEVALRMLAVFNARLQQLHETVHGLVSERAIVRLTRFIEYYADHYGTETTPQGECLKTKLPYYQLARSIGISYEECVRLVKSLRTVLSYSRGGQITILDTEALKAIAFGMAEPIANGNIS